jgi:pyrrolidone-carboxylate peptidase
MRTKLLSVGAALAMFASLGAQSGPIVPSPRPKIMLTGYWPPSNEAVRQWSSDPVQNPGGWVGSDWEGRGYDVYAYFPDFSPPTCTSCGAGTGDLTVDYQDTSADFWQLANALQPIAVITFSRSSTMVTWEMEMNQYNRTSWVNDYAAPVQPTRSPPDASVPADYLRPSTLPVQNIVTAIFAAGLPVNPYICYTGNGGGFLSEFVAYHGVWYQDLHRSPTDPAWCVTAGHVHVGRSLSWTLARQAAEVTVREVIAHTDAVRAATICQQDLGFQGPGNTLLAVCGGPLNLVGSTADVRIGGAPPGTLGVLAFGAQSQPVPLFGGTFVPVPLIYTHLVLADANGHWLWEDGLTGTPSGLPQVYAQFAYLDQALPQGWGLSNALGLSFQ